MEEKHGKTKNKVDLWQDLVGLRKKKAYLDEKYSDIDKKIGSKSRVKQRFQQKNTDKTLLEDDPRD